MATKSKSKPTAKVAAVKAAPVHPHADLVSKPLTKTQQNFVEWLNEQTGAEVDAESVKLAVRLSGEFRNSPERKAARDARKAELAELRATADKRRTERNEKRAAALEAKAAAIREGKVRGPGRPRKGAESEPVEVDEIDDEDDDETPDAEVTEEEDSFEIDDEDDSEDDDDDEDDDEDDDDF